MWMLWRLRRSVAVAFVFAVVVTVWSLYQLPSMKPREMTMATATTQVVVDTPQSTMLDLKQDTYDFTSLRNRAILFGNLIASSPLRDDIGKRAGIPGAVIEVAAPRTPEQPRAVVGALADKKTTDILKSNEQYRLSIQANPTVVVLDIYAESPSAKTSAALANAAIDSLKSYLGQLAHEDSTPTGDQVQIRQLGRATGAVINGGISLQAGFLAFVLTFFAGCATAVFIHRVRHGWNTAAMAELTEIP